MAAGGLIALLDDIASMMDNVAVMAKAQTRIVGTIADKTGEALSKTAGVVSDDVALGAETLRVTELENRIGLMAKRELAIVWKVAKGSAFNKVWISALAIVLSAVAPWILIVLLTLGGAYLCMEGAEKVMHWYQSRWGKNPHAHDDEEDSEDKQENIAKLNQEQLIKWEEKKIRGAVRTDMVLSGEIILISLGLASDLPILGQAMALAIISIVMTVGVYGAVALLVKVDDVGLFMSHKGRELKSLWMQKVGGTLMVAMPTMMKVLTVLGVSAMLAVGGSIIAHVVPVLANGIHALDSLPHIYGWLLSTVATVATGLIVGIAVEKICETKAGVWVLDRIEAGSSKLAAVVGGLMKKMKRNNAA